MNAPLFENLEIKQFRAFESLTIEKLGHVNLIVGKNGVGKSTLLEALLIYGVANVPAYFLEVLHKRDDYRPQDPDYADIPFFNLFHDYPETKKVTAPIKIGQVGLSGNTLSFSSSTAKQPNYKYSLRDTGISFRVECGSTKIFIPVQRKDNMKGHEYGFIPEDGKEIHSPAFPCYLISSKGRNDKSLKSMWEKIALLDEKQDVIKAMQFIEPSVRDFMFVTPDNTQGDPFCKVRLDGRAEPVPSKTLGEGLNRVIGLSLALACCRDGMLLIDEIENGLHWSVLPDLWRFIAEMAKRLNVQVFATTHSHDCLRSFYLGTKDEAEIDPVAVRIEKDGGGHHAEIFDKESLRIVVSERIEIR